MNQHRQENSLKSQGNQRTENTAISLWEYHHNHSMASHILSITQFTTRLHIMQHHQHQHYTNHTLDSLPLTLWYHRQFQHKMCNLIIVSILITLTAPRYLHSTIYNRCLLLAGIQSFKILEINLTSAIQHSSLI